MRAWRAGFVVRSGGLVRWLAERWADDFVLVDGDEPGGAYRRRTETIVITHARSGMMHPTWRTSVFGSEAYGPSGWP